MNPIYYLLIGFGFWGCVLVWDVKAKGLTHALFWFRIIAPVIAMVLSAIALYLIITGKH